VGSTVEVVMRKRSVLAVAAALAVTLSAAPPAGAVIDGVPDVLDRYDAVGLVVMYDADGNPLNPCTGTLVARDTVVTAGHCPGLFGAVSAAIWFDRKPAGISFDWETLSTTGADPSAADAIGVPVALEGWEEGGTDLGRIDITWWRQGVRVRPERLAPNGYLDRVVNLRGLRGRLADHFAIVGYGIDSFEEDPWLPDRRVGVLGIEVLDAMSITLAPLPRAGGWGNGCLFDSGAPIFHGVGRGRVVVGVFQGGDCETFNVAYRVDTTEASGFIAD
jgi:hypothetical protein